MQIFFFKNILADVGTNAIKSGIHEDRLLQRSPPPACISWEGNMLVVGK